MRIYKSPAKLNVFLKIVGKRGDYHEIVSRFVRYDKLYDEISFVKKEEPNKEFEIFGNFDCKVEDNTIYKAYRYLYEFTKDERVVEFFHNHYVRVKKKIPSGGGLGGGSSNAATTLLALNKEIDLSITLDDLLLIGQRVGADVNFFLCECEAANVYGVGEKIVPIEDEIPDFELLLSDWHCNTARVFKTFRENFYDEIDVKLSYEMATLSSQELIKRYKPSTLNDLLKSLLLSYESLKENEKDGLYLSGSGSTFFKVKDNG